MSTPNQVGVRKSMRDVLRPRPIIDGSKLMNELLSLEKVERHWEVGFRRRFLMSKEDDWQSIAQPHRVGATQWDMGGLLCGALLMASLYGMLSHSPAAMIVAFFAMCHLLQLRLHRDRLTLHFCITACLGYTALMVERLVVDSEHTLNYAGIITILGFTFLHLVAVILLARYTVGRMFERFADSCLQFRIPPLLEFQSLATGVVAGLGAIFAVARLYCISFTAFVTVCFVFFSRLPFPAARRADAADVNAQLDGVPRQPASRSFFEACMPVVRCLISVMFTGAALCVCIASAIDDHVLSLSAQGSFKKWESEHGLAGDFVTIFRSLAYMLSAMCGIILVLQIIKLVQLLLNSARLRGVLEHCTVFMGKACVGTRGELVYSYHNYSLDKLGKVVAVNTMGKQPLLGYDRSTMTCYDIYLAMQRRALHALSLQSYFCYVPIGYLYATDRDSNIQLRTRVKLERMAAELDLRIARERQRRLEARRERQRRLELEKAARNRPEFISTSIPADLGIHVVPVLHDSYQEAREEEMSRHRSMSIPVNLSLCNVADLAAVSSLRDRMYQRRCVTTAVGDDFYLRRRTIIDRVRCSWLEQPAESIPLFETVMPMSPKVYRDPNRGDFNFNTIDSALSSVFRGLELMKTAESALDTTPQRLHGPPYDKYKLDPTDIYPLNFDSSHRNAVPPDGGDLLSCSPSAKAELPDDVLVTINMCEATPIRPEFETEEQDARSANISKAVTPQSCIAGVVDADLSPEQFMDAFEVHESVQFIDIGSSKSSIGFIDLPPEQIRSACAAGHVDTLGKWHWLDSAVNSALTSNGVNVPSIRSDPPIHIDTEEFERRRPLEEILEGEYYINDKGELVVKSDSRYVPVRYHGERSVKRLTEFYNSGHKRAVEQGITGRSSDKEEGDHYGVHSINITTSPLHLHTISIGSDNILPVEALNRRASHHLIITDSVRCDMEAEAVNAETDSQLSEVVSFNEFETEDRPEFVVTREYELYTPFNLTQIPKGSGQSLQRSQIADRSRKETTDSSYAPLSSLGTDEAEEKHVDGESSEPLGVAAGTDGEGTAYNDRSEASSTDSLETFGELSPRELRKIAAARHLPLALDSRQEKVFSICPPRRHGAVVSALHPKADEYVDSVSTTPADIRRHKINGSSGCDYRNRYADSADGSLTSPGSSLATPSPNSGHTRPVIPQRRWRNEFDFSPVAVHSTEDVLRELMQDIDIVDSAVEDHASDVSHDFIFGR
ncbi:5-hydroxymethyluracil DNA glycosylase [Babesia ovata]|uniref:5-hydroxymethyluracil DNA glycosylase n=1 Tax=Babesia ovata TaxID=189622 RepID=A0A2H6K8S7_9APIC|nr:5-hydroxymethyluracil DNA glycosylase [Babesia ovata]GBE59412.1 5-hydroxymethyluracil DNA glycosylase [Babesia ovata]